MSEENKKSDSPAIAELKKIVASMADHLNTAKKFGIDLMPLITFISHKIVRRVDDLEERLAKLENK
jgi:hypothetical protein